MLKEIPAREKKKEGISRKPSCQVGFRGSNASGGRIVCASTRRILGRTVLPKSLLLCIIYNVSELSLVLLFLDVFVSLVFSCWEFPWSF